MALVDEEAAVGADRDSGSASRRHELPPCRCEGVTLPRRESISKQLPCFQPQGAVDQGQHSPRLIVPGQTNGRHPAAHKEAFYLFAAVLGTTWLATVPPAAGLTSKLFVLRYLAFVVRADAAQPPDRGLLRRLARRPRRGQHRELLWADAILALGGRR